MGAFSLILSIKAVFYQVFLFLLNAFCPTSNQICSLWSQIVDEVLSLESALLGRRVFVKWMIAIVLFEDILWCHVLFILYKIFFLRSFSLPSETRDMHIASMAKALGDFVFCWNRVCKALVSAFTWFLLFVMERTECSERLPGEDSCYVVCY